MTAEVGTTERLEIDAMVARARAAMRAVEHFDQQRVDRLCQALGWATANEKTFGRIVRMSIEESGLGDPEGRNQKRMKITRGTARCLAPEKYRDYRGDPGEGYRQVRQTSRGHRLAGSHHES